MELALTIRKAKTHSALGGALRQLLLLNALAYGIAYMVPACISFACGQVDGEMQSGAFVRGPSFDLHAELICESAPPRLWERSTCNLPK